MGGGWSGLYQELTTEDVAECELDHLLRWVESAEASLEHEPSALAGDYLEIQKTTRRVGLYLTQLGKGIASRVPLIESPPNYRMVGT